MSKKYDIKNDELGNWEEYLGIAPDCASEKIYNSAIATSKKTRDWYWTSKDAKKQASLFTRFLTFALVVIGAALPIFAGIPEDAEVSLKLTQSGVAALAVAGLLQAADRVFGWSSGWLRYISTVTKMEAATHKFMFDWAGYTINRKSPLDENDKIALYKMGRGFVDEILKLQNDETKEWISEYNSSIAMLSDLIQLQHHSAEKAQEAAEKVLTEKLKAEEENGKGKLFGGLQVNLKHQNGPFALKIGVDNDDPVVFLGKSWAKELIKPGQHIVRILIDQPEQEIRKVVKIFPDEITSIDIDLN